MLRFILSAICHLFLIVYNANPVSKLTMPQPALSASSALHVMLVAGVWKETPPGIISPYPEAVLWCTSSSVIK